jgi:radical SAM protein with 4Fe4S-binding SPASM domain
MATKTITVPDRLAALPAENEDVPQQSWPDGLICASCRWLPACRRSCLVEMVEVAQAIERRA